MTWWEWALAAGGALALWSALALAVALLLGAFIRAGRGPRT